MSSSSPAETMAGASWASNETVASGSSELWLGADSLDPLFTVTYSVVFVLGLVGNALALALLSCRARHTSHSCIYLINLALLGTLFVCVLPFKIHSHLHGSNWTLGAAACGITGTLFHVHIHLSIAFFTCLCVDRYVAVLHPFAYIQLRAGHCVLVATALWVVALGVTVPLVLAGPLHQRGVGNTTACLESFPTSSWTWREAPHSVLALLLGSVVPFSLILLGFPLAACRISRVRRGVSRRKALSTIFIILAICALCFLPYHLTHLLHFLGRVQLIQDESFSILIHGMRRVSLALVSLSCCLTPLLCYHSSSSKQCHCNLRLRFRSKKVFTICDRNFGEPSCDYKLQQRRGGKKPRGGTSWFASNPCGF
ncbi:lysophosphatidic acid receptor 6-like [Manacus candei]|uniref:lysophosphatidic acid receptor 6-like n=1 Tax=Manacus candei TaxID=415023 RepID=UPI0022278758|nr:lysophosphatidic acid receptor 6-like [Manacus candei]XP_051642495.1 lysophosphatidic acid receptor 6-like [Manacus candei]